MVSNTISQRSEERFTELSLAVADGIRAQLGPKSQKDLATAIGKSPSTISRHLSGEVNLTLKTIVTYEDALSAQVVDVSDVVRPKKRRRRSTSASRPRRSLEHIDPVTRRLQDLLTDMSARMGQLLAQKGEMSQEDLAARMGKDPGYVSRVMGGGVNLTLRTIAAFEIALGERILSVPDSDVSTDTENDSETGEARISTFDMRSGESNDRVYVRIYPQVPFGGKAYAWTPEDAPTADEELIAA